MKLEGFKVKVKNIDVVNVFQYYNLSKYSKQIDFDFLKKPELDLVFSLEIDKNDEGIDKISPKYTIEGELDMSIYIEDLEKELITTIQETISDTKIKGEILTWKLKLDIDSSWKIENKVVFEKTGSFYPSYLEINLTNKKIIVE